MNTLTSITVFITLTGTALIGGIFFAFSNFIMKAFARLPASTGIAAMQSINIVVLNPLFLGLFMGTAAAACIVMNIAIISWGTSSAPYFFTGALLYLAGTFMVTGLGNVPLNKQLAATAATNPVAQDIWNHYLDRWTHLNTIRTVSAVLSAVSLLIGLIKF